jgi:hypothetical protein
VSSTLQVRSVWLAGHAEFPNGHPEHDGLIEAFAAAGVDAAVAVWDDPAVDWSGRDLVWIRETWDYTRAPGAFLGWADHVASVTCLVNPPEIVRWNHHKGYLLDLAADGVPVVPTVLVATGLDAPGIPEWPELVVKPAIGVGGDGAFRVRAGSDELARALAELGRLGDVLVQPFLPSVVEIGETSLVMLGEDVTHAVRKAPATGEFRVHEERGGTYRMVEPTDAQIELARRAVRAATERCGVPPAYARADMADGPGGEPLVMELELIEPSLYLHHAPGAARRFVEGLLEGRW